MHLKCFLVTPSCLQDTVAMGGLGHPGPRTGPSGGGQGACAYTYVYLVLGGCITAVAFRMYIIPQRPCALNIVYTTIAVLRRSMCMCTHVCICIGIYIYIYIYIYYEYEDELCKTVCEII